MSLSDLHIRAGTLAGQIKQADADVAESKVMLDRAEKALAREQAALAKHEERAAALRAKRTDLQLEANELLARIGEPACDSGEEVIASADVGGGDSDALPPADVFNQGIEAVQPWPEEKLPEPLFGDGPAPEYARR